MKRTYGELVLLLGGALLTAACGDDDPGATGTSTTGNAQGGQGNAGGSGALGGQGGDAAGGAGGEGGMGGEGGRCVNSMPPDAAIPQNLSETGLYADIIGKVVSSTVQPFEPQFALWSDGAEKSRFIYLPECEQIDTADMDFWQLPIGTRLFKEFVVGGARIETRMLQRVGPAKQDWLFAAYQWDVAETDAAHVPAGVDNANGTTHQIPSEAQCMLCHGGMNNGSGGTPSRALGFSAIQLSHPNAGVTLSQLIADDKLTAPPAGPFTVPGTPVEQAALGYLHANCGNCHNDSVDGIAFVSMHTNLKTTHTAVGETNLYMTAVDVDTTVFTSVLKRVAPGDPLSSAIHVRMDTRGTNAQMPPLNTGGSKIVDPTGLATVETWICDLGGGCP